jgi:hypothetical protein
MRKWTFVALLLVGATILGSTVLREPIANAAQSVDANIIGPLDGNGNVKVHEQGTANVSSQSVDKTTVLAAAHNIGFGQSLDIPVDVAAYREVHVYLEVGPVFQCIGLQGDVYAEDPADNVRFHVDTFTEVLDAVYQVPGPHLDIRLGCQQGGAGTVDYLVAGRAN